MAGDGHRIRLYGFGAAAHIVAQVAQWQGRSVFAFTRPGDVASQTFARKLGLVWAGGSDTPPPETLDAAIIFWDRRRVGPAGAEGGSEGRPRRLRRHPHERPPGLSVPAALGERQVVSVANLTRQDGLDFLPWDRCGRPSCQREQQWPRFSVAWS